MAIFKEWLSSKKSLTAQQDRMASSLFAELKEIFAGGFQKLSDVAHLPLDKQDTFKSPDAPPAKGLRALLAKLDKAQIFDKAKQISPDIGKKADNLRNLLTSDMDDGQPNPSINVGKFINLLFGRDDAIQYYESGNWKKNTKVDKQPKQPPMQETPPPEQQPPQAPPAPEVQPNQPPMGGQPPTLGQQLA